MNILWVVLAAVFLAVELGTVALVSLWFVIGSLAALVASLLGAAIWLQILIFALVTLSMLLLLRPFLRRYVDAHKVRTNVDAVIGKNCVVTEAIDNLEAHGAVKLGGVVWTARSADDRDIPVGTVVTVRSVEGVKLMVVPAEKQTH